MIYRNIIQAVSKIHPWNKALELCHLLEVQVPRRLFHRSDLKSNLAIAKWKTSANKNQWMALRAWPMVQRGRSCSVASQARSWGSTGPRFQGVIAMRLRFHGDVMFHSSSIIDWTPYDYTTWLYNHHQRRSPEWHEEQPQFEVGNSVILIQLHKAK